MRHGFGGDNFSFLWVIILIGIIYLVLRSNNAKKKRNTTSSKRKDADNSTTEYKDVTVRQHTRKMPVKKK